MRGLNLEDGFKSIELSAFIGPILNEERPFFLFAEKIKFRGSFLEYQNVYEVKTVVAFDIELRKFDPKYSKELTSVAALLIPSSMDQKGSYLATLLT